ncbi:competence protein [Rhizobium cauense]|uniref:competence protein CoiA n=1 Tax=Rhizobium cauense TaxID=1166683 RepID=UPI001C6E78EE|nr:competence protein CoiA family protein [Rhizobium cauense]MBW9113177.1 competence protein [Rhizobium cauense]
MRYALVNGERQEATQSKLRGSCPSCEQEVVAKCGPLKIWHWAHKGKRNCDPWWEPETPWHRAWKDHFPAEWREAIQWSTSGEKHIADVRNAAGLVIEFQRSAISPLERMAREAFYEHLIWVVDGTRLKNDIPRFERGAKDLRGAIRSGYFMTRLPEECFPQTWIACSKPVFFDFGGHDGDHDRRSPMASGGNLWCLLPGRVDGNAVIARMSKTQFLEGAHQFAQAFPNHSILEEIAADITARREAERQAQIEYARRVRFFNATRRRPRF